MPLYWGDYWADTSHLSGAQHGAYLNLIGRYWRAGKPLPDDDALLWRMALADSLKAWKGMRNVIAAFFHIEAGEWRHKRVDAEIARAERVSSARRTAGAAGGRKSASKRQANAPPNAEHTEWQNPTPSPSQPQQSSEPIGSAAAAARPMTVYDVGEALLTLDGATKPATARSLIAKLCKANGDDAVQAAIDAIRSRDPPPADMKSALIAAVANRGKSNGRQSAMAEGFDIVDRIIAERG
jgi:uncharacterized protein YdaU (DUF1376 family)